MNELKLKLLQKKLKREKSPPKQNYDQVMRAVKSAREEAIRQKAIDRIKTR